MFEGTGKNIETFKSFNEGTRATTGCRDPRARPNPFPSGELPLLIFHFREPQALVVEEKRNAVSVFKIQCAGIPPPSNRSKCSKGCRVSLLILPTRLHQPLSMHSHAVPTRSLRIAKYSLHIPTQTPHISHTLPHIPTRATHSPAFPHIQTLRMYN